MPRVDKTFRVGTENVAIWVMNEKEVCRELQVDKVVGNLSVKYNTCTKLLKSKFNFKKLKIANLFPF